MGITFLSRFAEKPVSDSDSDSFIHLSSPGKENIKTVGEVSRIGKYYRHPDSALISYAKVVEQPLGTLPESRDYNIAIVGGGPSGIIALYELSRLARLQNSGKINITLYEPDLNHFTNSLETQPSSINIHRKRAGRVFSARGNDLLKDEEHSVYEIGAMRFPEIAGLTWHYVRTIFGDEKEIKEFPNPGKVPTEFVFGHRVDRYMGDVWLDDNSPTKLISRVVLDGINGSSSGKDTSLYPIGSKDPAKISNELKNKNTPLERLKEIQMEWKQFMDVYDTITLEAAVRRVIKTKVAELPEIEGIDKEEEKINYYFELFGCFGFGSGGFKSMFNMSFPELMRVILWDYTAEYMLPVDENIEFISRIYQNACTNNKNFNVNVERARVCDVCHQGNSEEALVFSYEVSDLGEESTPIEKSYDYVVLAVPPQQLSDMTSRAGFSNIPRNIRFGDYGRQTANEILARPPLILSNRYEIPNSKISTAIKQLYMISATKVFATIKAKIFNDIAPNFYGQKVKAIVSDCGLGSSYVIPSPSGSLDNPTTDPSEEPEYYSFLISYTWEEESRKLQHKLYKYPTNSDEPDVYQKNHDKMISSIINYSTRDVKDPLNNNYERWWFGKLLSKQNLTHTLSHDWTTSASAGAFKIDRTGGYCNSNLCFRYHTHSLCNTLNNRFFVANDSYSHLGGWLEGAFMSAVNAVSGIIVSANGGEKEGLRALSSRASPIIDSLERVV